MVFAFPISGHKPFQIKRKNLWGQNLWGKEQNLNPGLYLEHLIRSELKLILKKKASAMDITKKNKSVGSRDRLYSL